MVDKTDYMWKLFLTDVSSPIPYSFCLKSWQLNSTEIEMTDDNGTVLHLTESL